MNTLIQAALPGFPEDRVIDYDAPGATKGTHSNGGNVMSPLSVRGHDLYETPIVATWALIDALKAIDALPPVAWEPACGRGAIVHPLRAAGCDVTASDLVDYGGDVADQVGLDFTRPPQKVRDLLAEFPGLTIITNPPYKDAMAFVAVATELATRVIMLLPLGWISGSERQAYHENGWGRCRLARVWAFSRRLPMMHRDGWEGPKTGSSANFAWFEFRAGWNAEPTLKFLDWGVSAEARLDGWRRDQPGKLEGALARYRDQGALHG